MPDHTDSPEDLIAELARLMAEGGKDSGRKEPGASQSTATDASQTPPAEHGAGIAARAPAPAPRFLQQDLPDENAGLTSPLPRTAPRQGETPVAPEPKPAPHVTEAAMEAAPYRPKVPPFLPSGATVPANVPSTSPPAPEADEFGTGFGFESGLADGNPGGYDQKARQADVPEIPASPEPPPEPAVAVPDQRQTTAGGPDDEMASALSDLIAEAVHNEPDTGLAPAVTGERSLNEIAQAPQVETIVADEVAAGVGQDPIAELINAQIDTVAAPDEPPRQEMAATPEPAPATGDAFGVAPVFGIGSGTAAEADPPQAPDTLDDIESLIGNAVRQDINGDPAGGEPADAPPVYEAGYEIDQASAAAEAAILAATTASGITAREPELAPEDVAEAFSTDTFAPDAPAGSAPSRLRPFVVPAVLVTAVLAIGMGLFWTFGPSGESGTDAPILTADTTPVKAEPVSAPAQDSAGGSVVFNEPAASDGASEQLLSRDQTGGATGNAVSRVISPVANESGLTNRKVRTVTVRPDGTIVSGTETTAGNEVLPVDRPDVPELPGGSAEVLSANAAPTTVDPVASLIDASNGVTQPVASTPGAQVPGVVNVIAPVAPAPMPRLTNRATLAALALSAPSVAPAAVTNPGAVDLIGTTASEPAPASAESASVNASVAATAYVQLSSQRGQSVAQASLNGLQSRFGNLFGSSSLEIRRVDLGDKGVYHRVLLPASSVTSANSICAEVKSAGGDCFVRTD